MFKDLQVQILEDIAELRASSETLAIVEGWVSRERVSVATKRQLPLEAFLANKSATVYYLPDLTQGTGLNRRQVGVAMKALGYTGRQKEIKGKKVMVYES